MKDAPHQSQKSWMELGILQKILKIFDFKVYSTVDVLKNCVQSQLKMRRL